MSDITAQRGKRRSLFWRLWLRSISVKRPQTVLTVGSLLVGASVAAMLLNLYSDVRRKMTEEFRAYGANAVLAAGAARTAEAGDLGDLMDESVMARLAQHRERLPGLAAVPVLYAVARLKRVPSDPRLPEFENVVAVGSDFAALHNLYPGWRREGDVRSLTPGNCAVGAHIASRLRVGLGDTVELEAVGARHASPLPTGAPCRIASVLSTGASEDDQVFVPLVSLQDISGLQGKISLVELRVPGEAAEVERALSQLAERFPDLEVRPLRQIVYAEGKVLSTIRWLLLSLTALILVIVALCVAATMTAIVLQRRKDIAVMKALGASQQRVGQLFLAEGATLGLAGGLAGFAVGALLAHGVAHRLFGIALNLSPWTLPLVCLSSVLLAVLATLFPLKVIRGVQPAVTLKGE